MDDIVLSKFKNHQERILRLLDGKPPVQKLIIAKTINKNFMDHFLQTEGEAALPMIFNFTKILHYKIQDALHEFRERNTDQRPTDSGLAEGERPINQTAIDQSTIP